MKVRIVCYEDVNAWILGKFALNLNQELHKIGVESDIARVPDPTADINHHIIYFTYDGKVNSIDTLMVTHIDSAYKLELLKKQLQAARLGVCMSLDTMQKLKAAGIPQDKLYYINPAHDGIIKPTPTMIGITSKIHEDGRKQESLLLKLCKIISPRDFGFKIMGSGWGEIVRQMREAGFLVEYFEEFDYQKYIKLVPTFDYFFYFSFDEGSMAFMDALAAGVPTIVTPQGYHLDAPNGISYSVTSFADIVQAFDDISSKRARLVNAVSDWTWSNYAEEHVTVWTSLIRKQDINILHERKLAQRTAQLPKNARLYNPLGIFTNYFTLKHAIYNITPPALKNFVKSFFNKQITQL